MIINEKIIAREIHGETVLLNKENGDYFSLNSIGTEIYKCICDGMETEGIVKFLLARYNAEYDTLKDDVISLISELKEKNILMKNQ